MRRKAQARAVGGPQGRINRLRRLRLLNKCNCAWTHGLCRPPRRHISCRSPSRRPRRGRRTRLGLLLFRQVLETHAFLLVANLAPLQYITQSQHYPSWQFIASIPCPGSPAGARGTRPPLLPKRAHETRSGLPRPERGPGSVRGGQGGKPGRAIRYKGISKNLPSICPRPSMRYAGGRSSSGGRPASVRERRFTHLATPGVNAEHGSSCENEAEAAWPGGLTSLAQHQTASCRSSSNSLRSKGPSLSASQGLPARETSQRCHPSRRASAGTSF